MSDCTDVVSIYDDIEVCAGAKSLPGVRDIVYFIPKRDIVTWPTIDRSKKTALSNVAVYDGNFTLAADKKWLKADMIQNVSNITTESQGTEGSKTFRVTANLFLKGTEEEATGFISEANNDKLVFLVVQRNGKARVIGSAAFTPELTLGQDTGAAATDTNQTTVTVAVDDEYSAPFYPGEIVTSDGTVSGATGEIVTPEGGGTDGGA